MNTPKIHDALLNLKDAGAVVASGPVGNVLKMGSGFTPADLVLNVTDIEIATGTVLYTVRVQLSEDEAFTTPVDGAIITLGAAGALPDGSEKGAGKYVQPITNEVNGVVYGYMRLYVWINEAVTTGINFTAFLST